MSQDLEIRNPGDLEIKEVPSKTVDGDLLGPPGDRGLRYIEEDGTGSRKAEDGSVGVEAAK